MPSPIPQLQLLAEGLEGGRVEELGCMKGTPHRREVRPKQVPQPPVGLQCVPQDSGSPMQCDAAAQTALLLPSPEKATR